MSIGLGVLFVLVGLFFHGMRGRGFFKRRSMYRLVPNFLIANGIGFFIPLPAYVDGLALVLCAAIIDEIWFYRTNIGAFYRSWRDWWDELQGL